MRILPLSDLHLEFAYNPEAEEIVSPVLSFLEKEKIDIIILAGDITSRLEDPIGRSRLKRFINSLLKAGDHQVIYVPGNHEYYYSSVSKVTKYLKTFVGRKERLYILQEDVVEISEVRFIGTTMWFGHDPANIFNWHRMSDSICVEDSLNNLEKLGESQVAFILNSLAGSNCKKNLVITHLSPSHQSVPEIFKTSKLNKFFVNDQVEKALSHSGWAPKPDLWIHGHTHTSFDYQHDILGRVVCNPYGYLGVDWNDRFNPELVIEV